MNRPFVFLAALVSVARLAEAVPSVDSVELSQTDGKVRIDYVLSGAPAVVTLDIQTNVTGDVWASIGGRNVQTVSSASDVWKKVTANGSHAIEWNAARDWPGHANVNIKAVVTAWAPGNTPDYLVVNLTAGSQIGTERYFPSADFLPGGLLSNAAYRTSKLVMRKIIAKDIVWNMGSVSEDGRVAARETLHQVELTNNYYIGVFQVTQSQFANVSGYNNSRFAYEPHRAMRPVEYVSYNEIRCADSNSTTAVTANYWPKAPHGNSFLGKLRAKTGIDFDLPGEAEWEFACRAGHGDGYWGDGSAYTNKKEDPNVPGRYAFNGGKLNDADPIVDKAVNKVCPATYGTAIVGSYPPNSWGIYDMHGNVQEWCLDWLEEDITKWNGRVNVDPKNPAKTLSGATVSNRITRGHKYTAESRDVRSARRGDWTPQSRGSNAGFRVVCRAGLD